MNALIKFFKEGFDRLHPGPKMSRGMIKVKGHQSERLFFCSKINVISFLFGKTRVKILTMFNFQKLASFLCFMFAK